MSASGYILVLLSFAASSEQPHAVMAEFKTLELCQAAAQALAAPGTIAGCLPGSRISEPGEDTSHTATQPPPPKRTIPAERRSPRLRNGILTPPQSD
jgi:hypothetical protein